MKGIVVSVEYGDLLAETLPHVPFEKVLVVTSHEDEETVKVAKRNGAEVFQTNAFYRDGAMFNKGLALEEGFDVLGRDGWIVVFDADIIMPEKMDLTGIKPSCLYSPRRRTCHNVSDWKRQEDWSQFPLVRDQEHAGYFQLFNASDPALMAKPWYGVEWRHAGGCDSEFNQKWPIQHKHWLPFEVLHLGPDGQNWCGRATKRLDGTMPKDAHNRKMQLIHM